MRWIRRPFRDDRALQSAHRRVDSIVGTSRDTRCELDMIITETRNAVLQEEEGIRANILERELLWSKVHDREALDDR